MEVWKNIPRTHGLLLLGEDRDSGNMIEGRKNVELIVTLVNAAPEIADLIDCYRDDKSLTHLKHFVRALDKKLNGESK